MEKTYNINDIYVGDITRKSKLQDNDYADNYKKVGLFVKTLFGYKHILTGATYGITSSKSDCNKTLKSTQICKVTDYDNDIVKLVFKNIMINRSSYRISLYEIDYLEYVLNNELKRLEEKELSI